MTDEQLEQLQELLLEAILVRLATEEGQPIELAFLAHRLRLILEHP